jgi:hypothetical protein
MYSKPDIGDFAVSIVNRYIGCGYDLRGNSIKSLLMTLLNGSNYKININIILKLLESLIYKGLFIAKHETHRSYCS